MIDHAPNVHPGGVHGALHSVVYHYEETPLLVNTPPKPKAAKFNIRKITALSIILPDVTIFSYLSLKWNLLIQTPHSFQELKCQKSLQSTIVILLPNGNLQKDL